jgi:hypothetical protein
MSNVASAGPSYRIAHRHTIHDTDRQPELGMRPGERAGKTLRRDTDDLEDLPARLDGPADH